MDKKLENYIIVLLVIILISVAGCAQKTKEYKPGPLGAVVENAEAVGTLLGCMFNPKICQEMQDQKEWHEFDDIIDKK